MLGKKLLAVFRIALASWSGCAAVLGAQAGAGQPEMSLSAEIVNQRYCTINPGTTSLQMDLRLRYRNVGGQKLILYKGHDLFYQTRIRRAGAAPYEVTYLHSMYFDEEFEPIDEPSPSRVFVTLPPGAVYERELRVSVGLVGEDARRGNHAIGEGEHSLQLIISTWYKSRPLAHTLRRRWERKGVLWFDPLASAPVRFTAKRPDALPLCN